MDRSKLIIVEGAQGAGKTTVTEYIRNVLVHTNLYRLNGISDSSPAGYDKSYKMYSNLLEYMQNMENLDINLLFDRTFFSEENYTRLGKKEYSFSKAYYELVKRLNSLDFDIYYITIYLEDETLFESRLKRETKAGPKYAEYKAKLSIEQQQEYLKMAEELTKIAPNIKVFNIANDKGTENVFSEIRNILNILSK